MDKNEQNFWLCTADMGYGHQRVAYTLKNQATKILNANNGTITSEKEKKRWKNSLFVYEFFSRSYSVPVVGKYIFSLMDILLKIPPIDPFRDLSRSTFQSRMLEKQVKNGLCYDLINLIQTKDMPLVTTFYAVSAAADLKGIKNIYCIICDVDLNRVWVADKPEKSNIKYLAPDEHTVRRLKMFGVQSSKIYLTGPPLPDELVGGPKHEILKHDLLKRLKVLSMNHDYKFHETIKNIDFKNERQNFNTNRHITITYVVGGAGALKEIGKDIAFSLRDKIMHNEVTLNLVAGTKLFVKKYYDEVCQKIHSPNLNVIYSDNIYDYFEEFNQVIRETDILWTKPGELTFYCALGFPIIIADPIGSQEEYNKKWLIKTGGGIPQKNPKKAHEWLFKLIDDGTITKMAVNGYKNARQDGLYEILRIIENND